jgi:hypothetical protein
LPTSGPKQSTTADTPVLGETAEKCAECGKPLAADQRYCLHCGARRSGPRVPFEQHLFATEEAASPNGAAATPASGRQWSPLAAAAVLALLGITLLVGILIGKDANDEEPQTTAPAAAQTTTPSATTAAPPAATSAGATPAPGVATTPAPATGSTGKLGAKGAEDEAATGASVTGTGNARGEAQIEVPSP